MNKFFSIILISLALYNTSVNAVQFIDRAKCAFKMCKYNQFECYSDQGCIQAMIQFERCQIDRTSIFVDCVPQFNPTAKQFAQCMNAFCGYSNLYKVKNAEQNYLQCNNTLSCRSQYDLFTNRTDSLQLCYNTTMNQCRQSISNVNSISYHDCAHNGYFQCDYNITPYRDLPADNPARQYFLYQYATTIYDWANGQVLKFSFGFVMVSLIFF